MFNIVLIYFIIFSVFAVFFLKINNAYKNTAIIMNAIYDYVSNRIYEIDEIESFSQLPDIASHMYDTIQSYGKTVLRFWDWGYKNIVPPEIYELIKPFIKAEEKNETFKRTIL